MKKSEKYLATLKKVTLKIRSERLDKLIKELADDALHGNAGPRLPLLDRFKER